MIEDQKNTVIFDEVEVPAKERDWFARTFSKMEKDSLRSTVFLMMAGTLGAGVYTLHTIFDKIGIFWAIWTLLFGCISSLLALDMYIHASRVAGDPESVGDINIHILGKKFNHFVTLMTSIFLFMIMISFTVTIGNIVYQIVMASQLKDLTPDERLLKPHFFFYHRFVAAFVGIVGTFLILPKTADTLSKFSLASFLIHFYMITVIVGQTYSRYYMVKEKGTDNYNFFDIDKYDIFDCFGLAICAFNNVPNFMMARTLIKSPSTNRLRKVFNRANWIITAIYMLTGLCGYLSVGTSNMPDMIFLRESTGDTDYLINIGRVMLALSLIVSYSLLGYALKMMTISYIGGNENAKHLFLTLGITITVTLISMRLDDISTYINFAGCLGGTFIVVIFPGMLALCSGYTKNIAVKIAIIFWMVVSTILGAGGSYFSFMKVLEEMKKNTKA